MKHPDVSPAAATALQPLSDWMQYMQQAAWPFGVTAANDAPGAAQPPAPFHEEIDPPTSADRLLHAMLARFTFGISPAALGLAYADWAFHMALSPGKWQALAEKAARKNARLATYAAKCLADPATAPCIAPLPQDHRFRDPQWQRFPFNLVYQSFLLNQQWWHNATTGIGGVSKHHEQVAAFVARQLLDIVSPANFVPTNPELLDATIREGGVNLARRAPGAKYVDPETWVEATPATQGSWWSAWDAWLKRGSAGRKPPPSIGAPAGGYLALGAAPGRYVHEQ